MERYNHFQSHRYVYISHTIYIYSIILCIFNRYCHFVLKLLEILNVQKCKVLHILWLQQQGNLENSQTWLCNGVKTLQEYTFQRGGSGHAILVAQYLF